MNWDDVRREMGIVEDSFLNIGHEITYKICEKGLGDRIAFKWQGKTGETEEYSFADLDRYSNLVANMLIGLGAQKGDRVFTYLERIPELYFSAIGIWKAGLVFGPLFSSFGPDAVRDRLADCGARVLITQGNLLGNVLKVKDALPELRFLIIVGKRKGTEYDPEDVGNTRGLSLISFEDGIKYSSDETRVFKSGFDTNAIIHYTSGTTGRPKGALHTHGAILGHYYTSKYVLDLKDNDIYWCTADPAWVTGTSYGIIGPWSLGITQIAADGGYRAASVFDIIQKHSVNVWYTSPTLLRMLMTEKRETVKSFDLSSLRHIACVGEALNPEVLRWSMQNIGLPIHDTWFQTETGCIMICNRPGMSIKEGSMGTPIPPVTAAILDDGFNETGPGQVGHLALKAGWPSMFRTYWGRNDVYSGRFKNEWYITGDKAKKDEEGYFRFVAREDDVINTAGHLVSPFEVESALMEHEAIAEAAAIGLPDDMLGEKVKAFVRLKDGYVPDSQLIMDLRLHVRDKVSPFAVPQQIDFVESIPKTRSGKIMRRLLR